MKGHEGKVAVITGGARGLGQAYARRLAEEGVDVAVADLGAGDETVALVEAAGRRALHVPCDVAKPEEVTRLAAEVGRAFGRCDILVNNAGVFPNKPFAEMDFADWRRVLAINLDAMFLTAHAFVPGMRERGWGRIVNMASNTFSTPVTNFVHYVTSKGGVIGFTRSLASELGPHGITVNAIAPSLTRTPGTLSEGGQPAERFEMVKNLQSIKRSEEPADLVGTLAFLTSDESAFITGQTIVVDGGWVRT